MDSDQSILNDGVVFEYVRVYGFFFQLFIRAVAFFGL